MQIVHRFLRWCVNNTIYYLRFYSHGICIRIHSLTHSLTLALDSVLTIYYLLRPWTFEPAAKRTIPSSIFALFSPNRRRADPKSSVKQKQTLNKMRSEGSWTSERKEECRSLLFEFGLVGWLYIFLTFVSATFLQFICIHGYGLDWMWKCISVCVHVNVFTFIVFSTVVSSWGYFSPHFFLPLSAFTWLYSKKNTYTVYYSVSNFRIYTEPCMHSHWMCQRNPHDKWLECVYSFRHDDVFLQPSSWKPLFYFATAVVVDVVGIIFQWGSRILFAKSNIEREKENSSPSSMGWRNERKSTTIILEILSHAKVKGLKFIHWWCSNWQTAPLRTMAHYITRTTCIEPHPVNICLS